MNKLFLNVGNGIISFLSKINHAKIALLGIVKLSNYHTVFNEYNGTKEWERERRNSLLPNICNRKLKAAFLLLWLLKVLNKCVACYKCKWYYIYRNLMLKVVLFSHKVQIECETTLKKDGTLQSQRSC